MKLPPKFHIIFFGSPYSAKINLHFSIRESADKLLHFLDDREFAMIICNTKVMFIIDSKHICSNHLPWFCQDVMMYYLVLQLCLLKCKTQSAVFNVLYNVIIYIGPVYRFTCQKFVFSIPMQLMWSWSSACVFKTSSIATCLPFIIIPLITAMSSQNTQYVVIISWHLISIFWPVYDDVPLSHCK